MTLWRYSFSAFYLLILYPFRVHLIFNLHGPCKWNSNGDEKIAQNWDSLDFGERSCSVTTRVRWVTGNDPKNEKRNDAWIHIQYCTVYLGGIIIYHFVSSKCKQRYFFQVSQERTNIFEMLFFLRNHEGWHLQNATWYVQTSFFRNEPKNTLHQALCDGA